MIRIAIVEDDLSCAQQLKGYISRYNQECGTDIQVAWFPDGLDILEDYRPIWDMIFMDIEMPNLDGMSTAHRIREIDPAVVLIFITKMARFAIKGYEVDALDFVLKPVKYPQFALKLKKAIRIAGRRTKRYLIVTVNDVAQRIAADNILYIEVINHNLYLHTREGEYIIRSSLQEMEEQLLGFPFVRCSRSYLINLSNVTGFRKGFVQVPGQEIPVSRSKQKEILQKISEYMGGGFR